MTTQYTNQVLKVVVAQICENIGWNSITGENFDYNNNKSDPLN
jgi:hypothetical protein